MNLTAYTDYLIHWLENKRQALYQMDAYTLGVSGGVDSAVCVHRADAACRRQQRDRPE